MKFGSFPFPRDTGQINAFILVASIPFQKIGIVHLPNYKNVAGLTLSMLHSIHRYGQVHYGLCWQAHGNPLKYFA